MSHGFHFLFLKIVRVSEVNSDYSFPCFTINASHVLTTYVKCLKYKSLVCGESRSPDKAAVCWHRDRVPGGPGAPCQSCDLDLELSGLSRHWPGVTLYSHCVPAHPLWRSDFSSREYSGIIQKIPGALFLVMDGFMSIHWSQLSGPGNQSDIASG